MNGLRIKSIHIYGFGKYQDFRIYLQPGVNIIEGSNEAGKSTLLAFIKAILFGFEHRRNPEARYEPLEGGKFGGMITLEDETGHEYRIERVGHRKSLGMLRVFMPNGEEEGEEALTRLWGGISSAFYSNIQAFGLSELSYMNTLNEDEIAHYLYNSGTGISLQQMERSWSDEANKLFKPRGNQPVINRLLREVEELSRKISELQAGNESYNRLLEEKLILDERIREVETEIQLLQAEGRIWERARELLPVWQEWKEKEKALAQLPVISFPEQGLSRIQYLQEQIRELEVELEQHQHELSGYRQQLQTLVIEEKWLQAEVSIQRLLHQAARWEEIRERLASVNMEAAQQERALQAYLAQLGPSWDREFLQHCDLSLGQKEMIREQRQALHELTNSLTTLEQILASHRREVQDINRQLGQIRLVMKESEEFQPLSEMEEQYHIYQQLQQELHADRKEKTWREQQWKESAARQQRQQSLPLNPWLLAAVLLISTGLLASLFLFSLVGLTGWTWLPAAVGAVLAAAVWRLSRKFDQEREKTGDLQAQLNRELEQIERRIQEKSTILMRISREYFQGETDLQKMNRLIDHLRAAKARCERKRDQAEWLAEKQQQLIHSIEEAELQYRSLLAKQEEAMVRWEQTLSAYRFPAGLSADGVLELWEVARKANEKLEAIQDLQAKCQQWMEQLERFAQEVTSLAGQLGGRPNTGDPMAILQFLHHKCKETKDNAERRHRFEEKYTELEQAMLKRKALLKKLKEEQQRLYQLAGARDGEDFLHCHTRFMQRKKIEEETAVLRQTISRANPDAEMERLLDGLTLSEIEAKLAECLRRMQERQKLLQEVMDERGRLHNKLEQLEAGESLFMLNQQRQELLTELKQAAVRWTTLRMAGILLQRTRRSYESERQPAVLKQASQFFRQMTEGKYPRILSPLGEHRLIVERSDGRRLEPGYLSRGTREQLFLSLRLALVQQSGGEKKLPIILDDIFVNFDRLRTRAAVQTLAEISRTHQVLFFTCHPHVASMVKELMEQSRYINLDELSGAYL